MLQIARKARQANNKHLQNAWDYELTKSLPANARMFHWQKTEMKG